MALLPQNNASLDKKTGIYNYDRIFEKVAYVLKDSDYSRESGNPYCWRRIGIYKGTNCF